MEQGHVEGAKPALYLEDLRHAPEVRQVRLSLFDDAPASPAEPAPSEGLSPPRVGPAADQGGAKPALDQRDLWDAHERQGGTGRAGEIERR